MSQLMISPFPLKNGIATLVTQSAGMLKLVTKLQSAIGQKEEQIKILESRIDDQEQYNKQENIAISGLKTRHMSWARKINAPNESTEGEYAPDVEQDSLVNEVVSFI